MRTDQHAASLGRGRQPQVRGVSALAGPTSTGPPRIGHAEQRAVVFDGGCAEPQRIGQRLGSTVGLGQVAGQERVPRPDGVDDAPRPGRCRAAARAGRRRPAARRAPPRLTNTVRTPRAEQRARGGRRRRRRCAASTPSTSASSSALGLTRCGSPSRSLSSTAASAEPDASTATHRPAARASATARASRLGGESGGQAARPQHPVAGTRQRRGTQRVDLVVGQRGPRLVDLRAAPVGFDEGDVAAHVARDRHADDVETQLLERRTYFTSRAAADGQHGAHLDADPVQGQRDVDALAAGLGHGGGGAVDGSRFEPRKVQRAIKARVGRDGDDHRSATSTVTPAARSRLRCCGGRLGVGDQHVDVVESGVPGVTNASELARSRPGRPAAAPRPASGA